MVFSSPFFLFLFLPAVLGLYFLTPSRAKNANLLLVSLLFYIVGSGAYILILLGLIVLNYFAARQIERTEGASRKLLLAVAVALNLAPLVYYKYGGFAVSVFNDLRAWAAAPVPPLAIPALFLPAGISFFAFQGVAYLVDIYRRELPACRSLVDYALFKSFFPQLIAGPIVRYHDLARELKQRTSTLVGVEAGLVRFGIGLGKKVLLADNLGRVTDAIFGAPGSDLTMATTWLGVLSYTFQIFFDFSGYSDMAIGLGLVFGLSLPENFNQPYRSRSVTEFWRRWHMTLSSWFRDYLYIPLGGNRHGAARTGLNLMLVFFFCGLWHGAAYTFIIWGLYHGACLLVERVLNLRWGLKPGGWTGRVLTFFLVVVGWVFFRAHSLGEAVTFLKVMFGLAGRENHPVFTAAYYLSPNNCCYLFLAAVCAFWPEDPVLSGRPARIAGALRPYAALAVTALALIAQSPQSFNPFIYFQF